jgi:large subunit ribosomal protein L18
MKSKQRRKAHIAGSTERPRLVVYRSLKYIYGQIVDDSKEKTILTVSNLSKDIKNNASKAKSKIESSKMVGEYIAKKALEKKIRKVVFDRNGYKYHGRVKAFAEGARQGGLEF